MDDMEQVRNEQDRHMNLLHRNFSSLQSSLDTAQHVLSSKVHNYLSDNQTLLKEVNQLRSEVKSLSLENQRLAASIDFMQARRQEQIDAFNAQFMSTEDGHHHVPLPEMINTRHPLMGSHSAQPSRDGTPKMQLFPPIAGGGGGGPVGVGNAGSLPGSPSTRESREGRREEPAGMTGGTYKPAKKAGAGANTAIGRGGKLMGSLSQPLGVTVDAGESTENSEARSKASKGAKSKPLKSIEQLLGNSLDSYSTPALAAPPAVGVASSRIGGETPGKHLGGQGGPMTAEEKIAKIVELNLKEIRAANK